VISRFDHQAWFSAASGVEEIRLGILQTNKCGAMQNAILQSEK